MALSLTFLLTAAVEVFGELLFVGHLDKLNSAFHAFEARHFLLDSFYEILTHIIKFISMDY
jgi:hypothetical protein